MTPIAVDTLLQPRWIVPVEPHGVVLEDHALVVDEGRIHDLLPAGEARTRYRAGEVVELPAHALVPGFVNAHTHAAMTLFRGLADDLPLMTWLNDHMWPAEQRWVNETFVGDGTRLAAAEMIRGGTTCFNDMYFYPDVTARVTAGIGIRAVVGLIVLDFPTQWAGSPGEYLDKGVAVHDGFRDAPLVHTAFAPHAPYSVSDEPLARIATLAEELDIPVHMHVHETAHEVQESVSRYGRRPLARLDAAGLLSHRLVAVHMTQLEDDEIAAIAAQGVAVVHCPESNLKLASGFCPVARLLAAGVPVALGTDGAASNNDLDMLGELHMAALLAKGVAGDATALAAADALRMATLEGAVALGIGGVTGSLVPGKAADLAAVDLGALETEPLYAPLSQLVYAADRRQVSDVWVAGRRLLNDRKLTTIDEAEVLRTARAWQRRITGTP